MPNSRPQNWVMRFQISRPVITYTVSMITSNHTRPSVSGTKRKWYSAVTANCKRDRSTVVGSIIARYRSSRQIEMLHDGARWSDRPRPRPDEYEPQQDKQRHLHHNNDADLPTVAAAVTRLEQRFSGCKRRVLATVAGGVASRGAGVFRHAGDGLVGAVVGPA